MTNPGPAITTSEHPIGGGTGPAFVGGAGGNVGFYQDPYGGGAVPQPTNSAQNAAPRGNQCGIITTYASNLLSPAAVAQTTTAEQTLTPITGTGAQIALATGDFLYVNKPTSQAGLGVGNVRQVGAGTFGITFSNIPAGGNITPTATQSYGIVSIRGFGSKKLTATLTPASVPANSSVEQQFTVVGIRPGDLVQVNKPTAQAGLDIGGCRSLGNNLLGITYINPTGAAIVPTSEAYTIMSLSGLDAEGNDLCYGFNVGAVGAIGAGLVVSAGSTALTGLLATDMVTGIFKPTPQAAATNSATVSYGIPTADTLTLYFSGIGTGATPTSSEIYGIRTYRANPVAPLVVFTQTLTPVSVAALTTAEQTFAITGSNTLIAASPVWVNKSASFTPGLAIVGVRVSAANTLAINYANLTTSAITPPAETYTIGNFQVPLPGTGNYVYQTVSVNNHVVGGLANAIRTALAPTTGVNLIAGA